MLVLQLHFNLSNEELELQVNDRRLFKEFVALRETLENRTNPRENGPVIAGLDRSDGRQAARFL